MILDLTVLFWAKDGENNRLMANTNRQNRHNLFK